MTGSKPRYSCNPVFQTLEILTVTSQYLFSLMKFLIHNLEYFTFHSSIHSINTTGKLQKHRPLANPVSYQKCVYYADVKTFNELPISIARSGTEMIYFIAALKRCVTNRSFHSFDEYLHTDVK